MRWSQTLIPTLRNVPKDAEAASHQLALRAGLVRQLASGVYSYLPMGFRVLHKIITIVREEMNKANSVEVLLPALHPADIWRKSGRFEKLGDDKISFKNRAGHEFVLAPTHEEVITELVGGYLKSFRDLPLSLFQIQTKFRDEARPRFGVIRTKEFIMKDAYSFHASTESLDKTYQAMADAYNRIFTRCGLKFQIVSADSGMMGGSMSQEFMVVCPYGEDRVAISEKGYMASVEIANRMEPKSQPGKPSGAAPEIFDTPNLRTIDEITYRFKLKASQMIKTMIYMADDKPVAALVPGDSEVNEVKLRKLLNAKTLRAATNPEIQQATGAPVGFAGPVGLPIPAYADWDLRDGVDYVTGANEKDKHMKNVNPGRDFKPAAFGDIRYAKEGDLSPDGSGSLKVVTTMEIGHIFKLGTRYSESIGAAYLDEKGERQPAIMGCYGIGVNRILAAAIEEHHDEKGIKWPKAIAPFSVELITVNHGDEGTRAAADKIYSELIAAGFEALYDDRDERAGVKFNDAELIGIPVQVIVGDRNLKQNQVEVKFRDSGKTELIALDAILPKLRESLK